MNNSGPNLPDNFTQDTEPIEYLQLFLDDHILSHICKETNIYASKKKSKSHSPNSRLGAWKEVSLFEIKAFFGVIINMGLHPLPDIVDYFSTKWESRMPFFSDVFGRDEFLRLFWNLHFNHHDEGQEEVSRGKGFLIAPFLNHIREKCCYYYNVTSKVAVDESTILFKGKIFFRVYNPAKPTKFGIKMFVLSDSNNGYIYNFLPYFGKQEIIPGSDLLKTTQIVKALSQSVIKDPLNPPTGLHIYTDRYYSSPELSDELSAMNFMTTGTVMQRRKGMPKCLKTVCKKMKKGDIRSFRNGNKLVSCWKDKRIVSMISTAHKGNEDNVNEMPSKWPNRPVVKKPKVVTDYTANMGAVDRSDHYISSYQFLRRTFKWYRKVFFWLLEVSILNSYLLYKGTVEKYDKNPITHKSFRKSLVRSLVKEKIASRGIGRKRRGRPHQGPSEERLSKKQHFMGKKPRALRCVVCSKKKLRKETVYYCKTCSNQPSLHPEECFEIYHTLKNF